MFAGSIVALATPFGPDDTVDQAALAALIDFHVDNGTAALVIAGTTGESATLATDEHVQLVERSVMLADGRIPIIAGTGSNSTAQTIALSLDCQRVGVDGFLLVAPYYNKPGQEGMYLHFSAIADAVDKPVILYNVPGRTCSDLLPETVGRLSQHERIVGIKDATGDLQRLKENQAAAVADFVHLSGDDFTALEFLKLGGHGFISVTANIAPQQSADLCDAVATGDFERAGKIDAELQKLHEQMFVESNPIPVKWALARMGLLSEAIRLPLTPLAVQNRKALESTLLEAKLVEN
ncbi:MAG: 4-hydroxy-tetrahydrodipicolinate synthase [Pseudomonadota bacterium]